MCEKMKQERDEIKDKYEKMLSIQQRMSVINDSDDNTMNAFFQINHLNVEVPKVRITCFY